MLLGFFARSCCLLIVTTAHSKTLRIGRSNPILRLVYRISKKQNAKLVGLIDEFKYSPRDDPSDDNYPGFEHVTNQTGDTIGQICTYATAHAAAQFCTHPSYEYWISHARYPSKNTIFFVSVYSALKVRVDHLGL